MGSDEPLNVPLLWAPLCGANKRLINILFHFVNQKWAICFYVQHLQTLWTGWCYQTLPARQCFITIKSLLQLPCTAIFWHFINIMPCRNNILEICIIPQSFSFLIWHFSFATLHFPFLKVFPLSQSTYFPLFQSILSPVAPTVHWLLPPLGWPFPPIWPASIARQAFQAIFLCKKVAWCFPNIAWNNDKNGTLWTKVVGSVHTAIQCNFSNYWGVKRALCRILMCRMKINR